MKDTYILWGLVLFAFLLRLPGISYGLPLQLVADEPPFVLGALEMLEHKTVVPALNPEVFRGILYYPPYLSYLLLLPFAVIVGVAFALFQGPPELFTAQLLSDLSPFFIAARLVVVVLGVASVYLLYCVAQSVFTSRTVARVASFLLATSLLHEAVSLTARQWLPVSFLFLLVFYTLTREQIPLPRKLFYSLLTVGLGMGISTIAVLALVPIGLWLLFESRMQLLTLLKDRFVHAGVLAFLVFAPLPTLLNPQAQGFLHDLTLAGSKTFFGALQSPLVALGQTVYSEPILVGLFLVGLIATCWTHRNWFVITLGFFLSYVLIFYFFFRFEPRFMLPLIPLYALLGGYAFARLKDLHRYAIILLSLILVIPFAASMQFSSLAYTNDTRALAREWVQEHLAPSDKVLVYARLTRLPATPEAVKELRAIDKGALRRIDEAEETLGSVAGPHALNLYAVTNEEFFKKLPRYARTHGYTHLLYEQGYAAENLRDEYFEPLISTAVPLKTWQGLGDTTSITESSFRDPPSVLFSGSSLGPTIVLYQLQ